MGTRQIIMYNYMKTMSFMSHDADSLGTYWINYSYSQYGTDITEYSKTVGNKILKSLLAKGLIEEQIDNAGKYVIK